MTREYHEGYQQGYKDAKEEFKEPVLDELRSEIIALQNRCYVLTQGQMCSFCPYECRAKENFVPQESEG